MAGKTVGELQIELNMDEKSLNASMKNVQKNVQKEGGGMSKAGTQFGMSFGSALSVATGMLAAKAATAVVDTFKSIVEPVAREVVEGGLDRAIQLENAQAKLKGLGHTGKELEQIMQNVKASVLDTAYGSDEMANVAASAIAAGIKPGQELEKTLKLVADAATIAQTDVGSMGAIFNKVIGRGKITAEEINQLTDRGIGITNMLAKSMGKSTEEVQKLVREGKVGFPEFQKAIEENMGGAALEMGNTFEGAIKNLKASLRIAGQELMEPLMQGITPAMNDLKKLIKNTGNMTKGQIEAEVDRITSSIEPTIMSFFEDLGPMIEKGALIIGRLMLNISKMLPGIIQRIIPSLTRAFTELGKAFTYALPFLIEAGIEALGLFVVELAKFWTEPGTIAMMMTNWLRMFTALINALTVVNTALIEALPMIIDNLVGFLTSPETIQVVLTASIELFMALVRSVPQILNALVAAFVELFRRLWDRVKAVFGRFAGQFGDTIKAQFKQAINGAISFLEKAINAPINIVNGFVDVINGAFGAVGVNIGKIPPITMPRLAEGGVATASTVANIGENGREAVLPLDRNTDNWSGLLASALADEFDARGGGGGGGITIEKQIFDISNEMDADDIGRKVMNSLRRAA